jgi:hydroxypyruvate reductase
LKDADIAAALDRAANVDVIAAGKAAAVMLGAFATASGVDTRRVLAIGPGNSDALPDGTQWQSAGHPLPNDGSVAGARGALRIAQEAKPDDLVVVLLSGGGSALMALPAEGLTLSEKQQTARTLMERGADIYELNTVRKHLSAIKGGQLAARTSAHVLTLAISDVVGDDLSVIASGPTVPDESTYAQALDVLGRRGGHAAYPDAVVNRIRRGVSGQLPETPKTGDARMRRAVARVIGPQRGAIEGAHRSAESLGYHVYVVPEAITGEARDAGVEHVSRLADAARSKPRPLCLISAGETTVTVTGSGKGGRNQEFALAMAGVISRLGEAVAAASIGTDGIDGPTDAAGAVIDSTTLARAAAAGLKRPELYLSNNDTYSFFGALGDLIHTGPTSTNVGDLQIVLVADATHTQSG